MDGARITSVNAAFDKAFTAAGHRVPTSELKEDVWSGGGAFGIGARICAIGGGIPIIDEDGYILVVADRYREGRNVLLLFEASDITRGPLAEIKLPFKLMDGLHGSWVDGKDVDAAREASDARRANGTVNGK